MRANHCVGVQQLWSYWLLSLLLCIAGAIAAWAQAASTEGTFPQSKVAIEKALKRLQPFISGRLPTLEGFADSGDRPLERFQRGYFQCIVTVKPDASGGSQVRVSAKITAWYAAAEPSHAGYQELASNGRLESDLLERLREALGDHSSAPTTAALPKPRTAGDPSEPTISAPMPRIPDSALHAGLFPAVPPGSESLKFQTDAAEKHERELAAEAKSLEEILQNQSRPGNLVAVKRDGTAVLQSPRADASRLFAASAGDEFEILDLTADWVHVRISGLSRGWIQRSRLEMPEGIGASGEMAKASNPAGSVPFRVTGQQFAPFPGDWASLRGKTVEILSIQKTSENADNAGPHAKLEFARALLNKEYASASVASDGIVLIFDSEDGGMVAATVQSLQEWRAGKLTDDVFWHQCFFDPPEIFESVSR